MSENEAINSIMGTTPEWMMDHAEEPAQEEKDNQGSPGSLRGDVTVTLHTREVYRLMTGLDPRSHERTKGASGSLFNFEKNCQAIEYAVQHDDPYADYYFYHLHQRINETHTKLQEELKAFSSWLRGKLPDSISYTESSSVKPTVLPVRARTKLFYLALYLATDVDKYCRLIYLACHFALIPKSTQSQLIYDKLRAVRSITEEANKFRHTEAVRDDFAANNARARAAIEKHGFTLKNEFLRGDLRSTLAPEITRRPELDAQAKEAVENVTDKVEDDPLLQTSPASDNDNSATETAPQQAVNGEREGDKPEGANTEQRAASVQ